jgi:subtilisin family serine protease
MKRAAAFILLSVVLASCSDTPPPSAPPPGSSFAPLARSATLSTPIPGRYIVVFKNNVTNVSSLAAAISSRHQSTIAHVYTSAIKGVALALSDAEAQAMRSDPNVAFVEQDQTVVLQSTQTNAPWGIDRTDQRALPLSTTYVYNADGTGVTAYIIDTGINYTHTDFGGRAVKGVDEVTVGGTAADCHGHGSGVASLVGGAKYGVAKNVRLVAVRVVDCGANVTASAVIAGVDWVTANRTLPAVANMSMTLSLSAALTQAIETSISSGVVYAVAAGNNSNDACTASPANTPNALTVGATNILDGFASFSSFGPCVDINAPGENIKMAWFGSTTATRTSDGTSFASPHVAGTAALYLQAHPTATPAQVRSALVANATANVLTNVPANTPNLLAYSGFVVVGTPPVANFTSSCSASACSFDATSSTALANATYGWTFGDATSGSGKTPSHTYSTPGTYTVTLAVTDANGTSIKTKTVSLSAPNQPPVARFSFSCVGMVCLFDGSASSDDFGIVNYAWTWGDGRSESHVGATAKNGFLAPATYSVTLTVQDGSSQTNSITQVVQVLATTNHAPAATIALPTASATFVQGASVSFVGAGLDLEDGALAGASLIWTSSIDGQIGTGASFSKTNLSPGSHLITLTAKDAQGAIGTATRNISITGVNHAPTASISLPTVSATFVQGSGVSFIGTGSDQEDGTLAGASLTWSSSISGQIGTGASFSKTNLAVGSHVITLTARDAQGATGTATRSITITAAPAVNQPPVAQFTSTCAGFAKCALSGSNSTDDVGVVSYTWDWGNGRSESHSTPAANNTWSSPGTYRITLTVKDAAGLTGTFSQNILVQ